MKILEKFIKDSEKKANQCIHDPNSLNSTLVKGTKRTMVNPETINYVCRICHKSFRFQKNGTVYSLLKDE